MRPGGEHALILTWHSVSEDRPPLSITPEQLDRQLGALERAGYRAVPLGELVEALERGLGWPQGCMALTFDDGYRDFATGALPVLERHAAPATLFATASSRRDRLPGGTDGALMPLEMLAELPARGVEIGAHSIGHVDLTGLDDAPLEREIRGCREALEAHVGRPVEHFAYPFGAFDARVRTAVARVFRSACTTELARARAGQDPWRLPRVDAHYLRSPLLRGLLAAGAPDPYLRLRRRLRQWRGSEPARVHVDTLARPTGAAGG